MRQKTSFGKGSLDAKVPEEKQSEVKKPPKSGTPQKKKKEKAKVVPQNAPKKKEKAKAAPKKEKAKAPTISKTVPEKAGEVKNLAKVSIGNILKLNAKEKWIKKAKIWKKKLGKDLKFVENKYGPKPEGVLWKNI